MKKPRSDAKLQGLPEAAQEEIIEQLKSKPQPEVRELIRQKHGIVINSNSTLSAFWQWWHSSRQLQQFAQDADHFRETIKAMKEAGELDLSDASIVPLGQAFFEHRAMQLQDADMFATMKSRRQVDRSLDLRAREVAVKERAIAVLERKAAKADAAESIVKDKTLSEEERAQRMRALFSM